MIQQLLKEVHIAPSILSADFGRLEAQVAEAIDAGARVIHVDVMDGHFVPNITIGPVVVKAIAPMVHERGAALDVHLMIESPERYVQSFADAGADTLVVHQEACIHLHSVLAQIRQVGVAAGVAINPATPVETLSEARYFCDLALVMSVNPGFGGQSFIPTSLSKLAAARAFLPPNVALQVDGGVTTANVAELVRAGANWLVAGFSVYGRGKVADDFRQLSSAAGAA